MKKHILNKKDFSYVLKNKSNIVITGDSLAYNRYGFMNEPRMDAWQCYAGMKSWSFLLRDYIILNQSDFIKGRDVLFDKKVEYKFFSESKFECIVPFLYEGICVELEKDSLTKIKNISNKYMYILTDPNYGGLIEVDNIIYDISGDREKYFGYDIKIIPIKNGTIKSINSNVRLNIIGFSEIGSQIFLTGSGSKTTKWLYDNLNERVLDYNPDLLIMIIGANDRSKSNVHEAHDSLINILNTCKCDVIIISSPHSSTTDPNNGSIYLPDEKITKPLINNMYKIVKEKSISFIDLFKTFNGIESSIWRIDNVHFTIDGNKILFNEILINFFGGKK